MVKGLEPTAIPDAYVISKNEFDMDVPATERQTDRFGLFKWAKIKWVDGFVSTFKGVR